jgi:hypothetical protein
MPTAIGDVVPALASLFTSALAAEPTLVYAGPKVTSEHAKEYVEVAHDPDGEAVVTDQQVSDLGNRWIDESGDVTCRVVVWSGDGDAAPLLARADDLFDILDVALAADPRLGGVISSGNFARALGSVSLAQVSDSTGVKVTLTFTVHYSTLLTT